MKFLRSLADRRNPRSLSASFRRRRARHLGALLSAIEPPFTILDVGGEAVFWQHLDVGDGVSITLLNSDLPAAGAAAPVIDVPMTFVAGDARDLSRYPDGAFDVVISNSVIEHVGRRADQQRMADEIRRVGKRYYVQTPNRWFPVDPHYLVPLFHLLPRTLRVWFLMRVNVGWLSRTGDRAAAEALDDGIVLLSARDLTTLFPGASLWRESLLGMTKSLVVFHGWKNSSVPGRSKSSLAS